MALPLRPCAMYWVYWAPVNRLSAIPTTYNVIFLFHATGPGGGPSTDGSITLNKPTGAPGTNYNVDIATCRARGQKIIMTVGGAGAQVTLDTQAKADAFIASVKSINVSLGGSGVIKAIDGIDFNNFEGASSANQRAWMTYAAQQLKSYYGSDFLISAPPAAFGGGQDVSDRLMLATMYKGGALDWFCPQFYDPSDLNTTANVRYYLDFYNTAITVDGVSTQIPRNTIGIGFAIKSGAADTSRWSTTTANSCYNTMTSEGKNQRGAFNWSSEEDPTYLFATNVGPTINPDLPNATDTTPPTPGGSGVITTANVLSTSLTLNWTLGTDDQSPTNTLQYEVRRSLSNNMGTLANAKANGTIVGTYTANISTKNITGLTPSTTYYFNIIIKDQQGNEAIYVTKSQATPAAEPPVIPTAFVGMSSMTGVGSILI